MTPKDEPTEPWTQARERMADGLETMLCFDFGLTGAELYSTSSWVLDDVIRPEFEKLLGIAPLTHWCLMRLAPGGEKIVVQSGLSQSEAAQVFRRLQEEKQQGQHWLQRCDAPEQDA
jgi:hypothetical protein